ncbi:hypothetical protein KXD93_08770 [Mucilaginibacter sp. BJC16-A38]|uniref:hypothetical protein n=1 Tax=Mucilaginibacter phenanthrenivorans TaxID=1234842 RepID=UPI002158034A|nr:hypothetical protein [Mucilaginibacter phenanthrenivorans]MCR8557732.1 hypothetical protein [Mucilaginibacter phenanthrenivorans]
MKKLYLTIILFGACFYYAQAQDANYWSAQYNPAGILTPGSAVAFTRDSGLLYFNPALLAYNTKNSASISGSVYQLNSFKVKDGVGAGLNLKSSNVSIVPVMASGVLAMKGSKKFSVGYAIIQNPVINYQATQQLDRKFNVLNDAYSPGDESFLGQYNGQNTINETSALLSTGFKLSPKLAFGFSTQGQYRTQTLQENYSARAIINQTTGSGSEPITNLQSSYQVSHYNVSLKFKVGFAYDDGRSHLGLNFTSPLVKLKSSAELLSDNLITDLHVDPTDTTNLLASNRQTKLSENYKMPLSLALGYAYDLNKGQIYISAEYFNSVSQYSIITPRSTDFIRSNEGNDNTFTSEILKLKDARRSIINYGIGFTYELKPDVTGFISARTDFTYYDQKKYKDDDGNISNISNYNIYHMQIGGNLKRRKFNLRTGLLFDYGHTSAYPQFADMTSANDGNFLQGDTHNVKATYFSVGLMFAYIYNL